MNVVSLALENTAFAFALVAKNSAKQSAKLNPEYNCPKQKPGRCPAESLLANNFMPSFKLCSNTYRLP
jgi:hypothetical protein